MAEAADRRSWAARLLKVRWFVRAPIWLYRARLGFLFGSRLLMLEHIGRRSGAVRYVVLEVAGRTASGGYVVVSGFGIQAHWFQNVAAQPRVRISVGLRTRVPAEARQLSADEAKTILAEYAAKHPKMWKALEPVLAETSETGQVPVVELRPIDG